MRQMDMIEPELPLAGGSGPPDPLWAMQCAACGHRARWLEHYCQACGSSRTLGRDRASFEAHKRALEDFARAQRRRKAPPPEAFRLTPPPGPRTAPAAQPEAPPALLSLMQETRP